SSNKSDIESANT
ncbi:hypothetical protein DSL65_00270, partial [Metamycoplasma hominis]